MLFLFFWRFTNGCQQRHVVCVCACVVFFFCVGFGHLVGGLGCVK